MIKAICVNDSDRPNEIPIGKWLKKGNEYNVIYTVTVLPQRKLAFHLAEIDLDESCNPYSYFLADRFAFREDDLESLIELIKDCNDTEFSISELLKQTQTNATSHINI